MSRKVKIRQTTTNKFHQMLDDFSGGTNSVISEARLGRKKSNQKYALQSVNITQAQDGIWQTKPGFGYFGIAIPGVDSLDGGFEYVDAADQSTRHLLVVGGGKLWKSVDNGANWTEVTGGTFTTGNTPFFMQSGGKVLISNRVDPLATYNGTDLDVYSALIDPDTAPSKTLGAGLSAGSFTYYVRYTANNEIGYTNPSPAVEITADKPRNQWVLADNEYVDVGLTAVVGAESYDVWIGDTSGLEVYVGSTSDLTFRLDSTPENPYREAPDDNTTTAPKFGRMELSGNRQWGTHDPDHQYRVHGSGTGQYLGYFSPFYGGFWIDLEKGGKYRPVGLVHYRTGKGDPIMTVLCSSPDGRGTIFQIELTTLTVGDTNFIVPIAYKLVGSIGADAPLSITPFGDNVAFLNKKGVFFLRNKEQMFNLLSTDDMTAPIRDKVAGWNQAQITKACGYYRPPKLYFSVAQGTENDTIFEFDMERGNWNYGWTTGVKQFFEYTDTDGRTRLLVIPTSGGRLGEISENVNSDYGEAFLQTWLSPLFPIDPDDHTTRAKVQDVIFEIGSLAGQVSVSVIGKEKNKEVANIASQTASATTGNSGWGDDEFSSMIFSDTVDTPTTFASSTQKIALRPNKKLYNIQYKVSSNTAGAFWQLLSVQADGFMLPGRPPSQWSN